MLRIKPKNSSIYINHKKFEIKTSINTHIFSFHFHSYQTPYKNPTPPPFMTFEKNTKNTPYVFIFCRDLSSFSLKFLSLLMILSLSSGFYFLGGFLSLAWGQVSSIITATTNIDDHHLQHHCYLHFQSFSSTCFFFILSYFTLFLVM